MARSTFSRPKQVLRPPPPRAVCVCDMRDVMSVLMRQATDAFRAYRGRAKRGLLSCTYPESCSFCACRDIRRDITTQKPSPFSPQRVSDFLEADNVQTQRSLEPFNVTILPRVHLIKPELIMLLQPQKQKSHEQPLTQAVPCNKPPNRAALTRCLNSVAGAGGPRRCNPRTHPYPTL